MNTRTRKNTDTTLADAPYCTVLVVTKGLAMDPGFKTGDLLLKGHANTTNAQGHHTLGVFTLPGGVWFSNNQLSNQYKDHDRLKLVRVAQTQFQFPNWNR